MKVAALVPAAGRGERLGCGPKALIEVGGKTLLERAVAAFEGRVDEIVVAVSPEMQSQVEALRVGKAKVVLGGETRQASVWALLQACEAELVLIHDAARPFLAAEVLERVKEAAGERGAATAVLPVSDTLIEADSGRTVARERLRAVQTPQGFRLELIVRAHERARQAGAQATDDAGLVRALGHEVVLVAGSPWLFKLTTPQDLELARALAEAWDAR